MVLLEEMRYIFIGTEGLFAQILVSIMFIARFKSVAYSKML